MLAISLLQCPIQVRKFSCWVHLLWKVVRFWAVLFHVYWSDHVIFVLYSINVVYYSNWLSIFIRVISGIVFFSCILLGLSMRIILASKDELGNVPLSSVLWTVSEISALILICVNINLWHHLGLAFSFFPVWNFFFKSIQLFCFFFSQFISAFFFVFFYFGVVFFLFFFFVFFLYVLWSIKLGYWLKVFF